MVLLNVAVLLLFTFIHLVEGFIQSEAEYNEILRMLRVLLNSPKVAL